MCIVCLIKESFNDDKIIYSVLLSVLKAFKANGKKDPNQSSVIKIFELCKGYDKTTTQLGNDLLTNKELGVKNEVIEFYFNFFKVQIKKEKRPRIDEPKEKKPKKIFKISQNLTIFKPVTFNQPGADLDNIINDTNSEKQNTAPFKTL